jgi:hypothetical protein
VRSRHRQEKRHFEVVAGKVLDTAGAQHGFAFARNGQAVSAEVFRQALTCPIWVRLAAHPCTNAVATASQAPSAVHDQGFDVWVGAHLWPRLVLHSMFWIQ